MDDYRTGVGYVMECTACDNGGSGGIHNHAIEDCPFSCCSDLPETPRKSALWRALEWLDERDWPRINRNLDCALWAFYGPILMLLAFEAGWYLSR